MERFILNICLLSPDILLRSFSYVYIQKLYCEAIVNVVATSFDFNHFISIVYYIFKYWLYKLY